MLIHLTKHPQEESLDFSSFTPPPQDGGHVFPFHFLVPLPPLTFASRASSITGSEEEEEGKEGKEEKQEALK